MFLSVSRPSSHGQDLVGKDLRKIFMKTPDILTGVRSLSYPIVFS